MRKLFSTDNNFNHLLKGSTFNVAAKIVGILFGFFASILITKNYGSDLIGDIATITSAFTLLSLLALLGNQTLVLKVLPEQIEKHNYFAAKLVYHKLLNITLCTTICVIVAWLFIENISSFTLVRGLEKYIFLVAALVFLAAIKELNSKTLRGLGDYKIYSVFEILPALLLASTAIISIELQVAEHNFQYAYFFPLLVIGILSFTVVSKSFHKKVKNNFFTEIDYSRLPTKADLIRTSLPMLGVTLSTAIIAHFDILMLNYYTTSSEVGVYSVYVKIVAGTALTTHSINAMFAPTVSRLFSRNEKFQLKIFAKKTTLLSLSATMAAAALVIALQKPILGLFGSEFIESISTLHVLILSTITSSFFGSVGLYLNMTGNQVYFFRVMLVAALINILLNAILIPLVGLMGAAIATLVSVLTWNLLATYKIYREFGHTLIWGREKNA